MAGCNKPFRVRGIVRDAALQALLTPYVVTAAELDPARQEVEVRVRDGKMGQVRLGAVGLAAVGPVQTATAGRRCCEV